MALHHTLPDRFRLYAIGDIHGRADLLRRLLDKINADRTGHESRLIFLGDYIDRGLYSRDVIDILLGLANTEAHPPVFLLGNHEQVLRDILRDQNIALLSDWMRYGGRETLLSYGIRPPAALSPKALEACTTEMTTKFPPSHAAFLESLQNCISFGGYFFCHAGVRPGVPLDAQTERDLAWIRHDFLRHEGDFGKVVVHGHTISTQAEMLPNRINVDTGAYATGNLTALGVEGEKQWLLQTA